MRNLIIIPARYGSKRLINKNIRILGNKPLIFHTIDVVVDSFQDKDKIIFSSDSIHMLDFVQKKYNITTDLRPPWLATDTSKVLDTVLYYFNNNPEYDRIWYFLPTCPFRRKEDIKNCMLLLTKDYNSIISITDYDFPPTLGLTLIDNKIYDWHESLPWKTKNTRSQDQQRIYRPNGAIYCSWNNSLKKYQNFYTDNTLGYYMSREYSIDIDTELDLNFANEIIKYKQAPIDYQI